ncbi:MAG: GbsR/MarR family transcriptional regulator [Candidatus Nanoarchaeia archaeon]
MKQLDKELLEFTEQVFRNLGLDALSSKLIGILYPEPKEMSIEMLAKKTGYSLASVSTKMKFLENVEFVRKVKKPGSKKVYYYMEKDALKMLDTKFEKVLHAEVDPVKEHVPKLISKYKDKKLDEKSKKKLEIMKNYHKQMLQLEKILIDVRKKLKVSKK